MPHPRALRLIAAVATAVLIATVLIVVSIPSRHATGTNGAQANAGKPLAAGMTVCQRGERLEARTGRVRIRPVEVPATVGPFVVKVYPAEGGKPFATGRIAPRRYGKGEFGWARIPTVPRAAYGATVCVTNAGTTDTLLYGEAVGRGDSAEYRPGAQLPEPWVRIRLDYSEATARSWWSLAGTVADRFGLLKATFLGSWTLWVVLAALFALAIGAIWWAARVFAR